MSKRLTWIFAAVLAVVPPFACGDDDNGGNPDSGDVTGGCAMSDECPIGSICDDTASPAVCARVAPNIAEDVSPAPDLTCLHNNPVPVSTCPGQTRTVGLYVEDFQDDFRVGQVTIELFFNNVIDAEPDATVGPTALDGTITGIANIPCDTVIAYRIQGTTTARNGAAIYAVKSSVEYDLETPATDGDQMRLLSVSDSTYRLIPTILGITPLPANGIIAGEFDDCAGVAMEGVMARMVNSSGDDCHELDIHECLARYFVDSYPSRLENQAFSSDDGLFAVAQVPEGDWSIEIVGWLDDSVEPTVLGRKAVQVIPDTIAIVDVAPLAD